MSVPEHVVVVHIDTNGDWTIKAWTDERVQIFVVDENAPDDRVYCVTSRETDANALRTLIGDSPIGHLGDGRLDDQTVQAVKAMYWRMSGGRLEVMETGQ